MKENGGGENHARAASPGDIVPTTHLALLLGQRFPRLQKMLDDHLHRCSSSTATRPPSRLPAHRRQKSQAKPLLLAFADGRSLVIDTENLLMDTEKKGCLLYRY